TTATSGIYNGKAGHTYQFVALATDNAGNREQPTLAAQLPADDSSVNLGTLPKSAPTTTFAPPPAPAPTPTNPLFVQAQQGIPAPAPTSHASEFDGVVRPVSAKPFAPGIGQSTASPHAPTALATVPAVSAVVGG